MWTISIIFIIRFFYDVKRNVWSHGPRMKQGRYGGACGVIQDANGKEHVVVTGGWYGPGPLKSTEILDVARNSWKSGMIWVTWKCQQFYWTFKPPGPSLPTGISGGRLVPDQTGKGVILAGGGLYTSKTSLYELKCPNCSWKKLTQTFSRPRFYSVIMSVPRDFQCA